MVLCRGSIPAVTERVISPSTATASPAKPTRGVETLLSQSVDSHIREKIEQNKTLVELPLLTRIFFYIIIRYCCRDNNSVIIGSLDSPNILICEDYYIVLARPLGRLFSSSRPPIQSSGDHVMTPAVG